MTRRKALSIAWLAGIALVVLHLDYWRGWDDLPETLLFGWLPVELAYRLVYVVLAWAYVLFVCRFVWREDGP